MTVRLEFMMAHRILMCYLIGLECAFVDLQRHEVSVEAQERALL